MALSRHHAAATKPLSIHEITEEAQKFDYNHDRPLLSWLRSAKMLLSEAAACEAEGNYQMAYLYTYRHAELVLSKLPHHTDASNPKLKTAINQARKQVNANFTKLESWKPRINRDYERYMLATQRRNAARESVEQQRRDDSTQSRLSGEFDDTEEHQQRKSLDAQEHHQLAIEIARRELSRREVLKRSVDSPQAQDGTRPARDMYTVGQLAQRSTPQNLNHQDSTQTTGYAYPAVPTKERLIDWTNQSTYQQHLAMPPVVPPKHAATSDAPTRPDKVSIDAIRYNFKAKAFTEAGSPLRSVILPSELSKSFLELARSNTMRDLETCGVLCATTISNALFINHLVIPDQNSTSDTCDATEEGDIALFDFCDKENLLVCGWIHTHPTQTCFMSSRDLHTSSGYQQMLPEAIAIVCAPRHTPDRGIFRLTDPPGLPAVLRCTQKGLFHPHAGTNLYTDADGRNKGHVIEGPQLAFKYDVPRVQASKRDCTGIFCSSCFILAASTNKPLQLYLTIFEIFGSLQIQKSARSALKHCTPPQALFRLQHLQHIANFNQQGEEWGSLDWCSQQKLRTLLVTSEALRQDKYALAQLKMAANPTLLNMPPPPADPVTPIDVPSRSGTPNSTTTSMSELSTVAIKDGHRGHMGHHNAQAPSGLSNQLDAERADRISRLAGLERVTTARNPTPIAQLTPGAVAQANPPHGYFDAQGNPGIGRERSTVGSASATGSVGARTTWAGSEAGDMDKMSESQDMEMETSSMGGMSDEGTGSLVAFGEGARTPARQSAVGTQGTAKTATPTARDARMVDGSSLDRNAGDTTTDGSLASPSAAEQAERIVRENMGTDSITADSAGTLGRLPFEK